MSRSRRGRGIEERPARSPANAIPAGAGQDSDFASSEAPSENHRRADGIAGVIIVCLAFAFFLSVFLKCGSEIVGSPAGDGPIFFYPSRMFANGELQAGRFPLWNPYIFCGHPFHAEGQGAVFDPLNLAFCLLPPALAMNLFAFACFAASGVFFYLFLRRLRLTSFSALSGALIYMFSSAPISRLSAGHYSMLPFLALVPAFLWLWEGWKQDKGRARVAAMALVYGCMMLAGHPQSLFYSTIYFGYHAVFDFVEETRRHGARRAGYSALVLGLALSCGALVGAVQIFPSYSFAQYSFRAKADYAFCSTFSFPPENLLTLLAPRFFGDMGTTTTYWGREYLWEMWAYIGVVPLALAIMAAVCARFPAAVRHATAVPVFIVLALGSHTPLFKFLLNYVPFFDLFRGNSKFIFFSIVSLCVLAAMGTERLIAATDRRRTAIDRLWLLAILGFLIMAAISMLAYFGRHVDAEGSAWRRLVEWTLKQNKLVSSVFSPTRPPAAVASWSQASYELYRLIVLALIGLAVSLAWNRLLSRPLLARGALLLLVLPDLILFCCPYLITTPVASCGIAQDIVSAARREKEPTRVLDAATSANATFVSRLESPLGYAGAILARANHFLTAANGFPRSQSMAAPLSQVTSNLFWPNVRFLLVREDHKLGAEYVETVARAGNSVLQRLTTRFPRAQFSSKFVTVSSEDEALEMIEGKKIDFMSTDIVEAPNSLALQDVGAQSGEDSVAIVERQPNRVSIETDASGSRLLVLADAFEPNWRCRLDERSLLTIYPVNIAFRGVVIPAGRHRIEFYYSPRSFYFGLATTCAALVFLAALAIFHAFKVRALRRDRFQARV